MTIYICRRLPSCSSKPQLHLRHAHRRTQSINQLGGTPRGTPKKHQSLSGGVPQLETHGCELYTQPAMSAMCYNNLNTSAAAGQLAYVKPGSLRDLGHFTNELVPRSCRHSPAQADQLKGVSGPPELPTLPATFASVLRHERRELQPVASHLLLLEGLRVHLLALHTDLCQLDVGKARPARHTQHSVSHAAQCESHSMDHTARQNTEQHLNLPNQHGKYSRTKHKHGITATCARSQMPPSRVFVAIGACLLCLICTPADGCGGHTTK